MDDRDLTYQLAPYFDASEMIGRYVYVWNVSRHLVPFCSPHLRHYREGLGVNFGFGLMACEKLASTAVFRKKIVERDYLSIRYSIPMGMTDRMIVKDDMVSAEIIELMQGLVSKYSLGAEAALDRISTGDDIQLLKFQRLYKSRFDEVLVDALRGQIPGTSSVPGT